MTEKTAQSSFDFIKMSHKIFLKPSYSLHKILNYTTAFQSAWVPPHHGFISWLTNNIGKFNCSHEEPSLELRPEVRIGKLGTKTSYNCTVVATNRRPWTQCVPAASKYSSRWSTKWLITVYFSLQSIRLWQCSSNRKGAQAVYSRQWESLYLNIWSTWAWKHSWNQHDKLEHFPDTHITKSSSELLKYFMYCTYKCLKIKNALSPRLFCSLLF